MNATITIQNVLDYARSFSSLTSALGSPVAGQSGAMTSLTIANEVVQEIKTSPFAWKWNRKLAPPIVINQYQQDYCTSILDLGWLEHATATNSSMATIPPTMVSVECVRELTVTNSMGMPAQLSWVYNSEAVCGSWAPSTTYSLAANMNACPTQPLTQIRDTNGNIQVVAGNGTTGTSAPTWATTPGQTTTDGTVTWTCINPNGIAFRVSPLPPANGSVWVIQPYYQAKASTLTSLSQSWGIPDELAYVYRQGFLAKAYKAAEDARWINEYAAFQAQLKKAIGGSDREAESFCFYPTRTIHSGYMSNDCLNILG